MNIAQAKQHVLDTVEAYFAKDEEGMYFIEPAKQRPLFLVGAPGIGKTAIMGQVAEELGIGLVSYSMTHHTRQSALGLPLIVEREYEGMTYEASEYTMSEIVSSVYDYMSETGIKQGILFLDEINCVSETLYPSMLQFLQFKTFGRHRIPDDWVVVCAGNPPEYNKSVHEFDVVTLDRLRRIEIEPDLDSWRAYAVNHSIHPAVLSFLDVKKEDFYSVISSPQGKRFVTARGWEDLSEVIKLFERLDKPVEKSLVEQFLQDEDIAERFATYYLLFNKYRSDYQVESILLGDVPASIMERAGQAPFDERLALMGLLLDALSNEMGAVLADEALLTNLRDVLRNAKPQLLAGASVDETLGAVVEERQKQLKRGIASRTFAEGKIRGERRFVDVLKGLMTDCAAAGAVAGAEAFGIISGKYAARVHAFEVAMDAAKLRLDNAFAFIDRVFVEGREELVFVTELTARDATSKFINRFGSDSYYAHNEGMKVQKHTVDLSARVQALGLDASMAGGAASSGMSKEQLQFEKHREYYAKAQFEYNFPSMCKMTLPDDLVGKTVLDLGCRRGKGVSKLSDRVGETGQVIGVEWAEDQLAAARAREYAPNVRILRGYPEELVESGISEKSCDVVFVNSVINLVYNQKDALAQISRVLKSGGVMVCETVLANAPRDIRVMDAARAVGNSVQAAPERSIFEGLLYEMGFETPEYVDEQPVAPNQGYKEDYTVDVVPSTEEVSFTAAVLHARKR